MSVLGPSENTASILCDLVDATSVSQATGNTWGCHNGVPDTPYCTGDTSTWTGVTCMNGEVVSLDLSGLSLTGTVPSSLGELSTLTSLDLSRNSLSKSLPTSLGDLSALVRLVLSQDSLTGSVPPELGQLSQLTYLNLAYNELTGPVASELGQLSHLVSLNVSHNSLSGSLPSSLCNDPLTSLSVHRLYSSSPTNQDLTCYSPCLSSVTAQDFWALYPCNLGKCSIGFVFTLTITRFSY